MPSTVVGEGIAGLILEVAGGQFPRPIFLPKSLSFLLRLQYNLGSAKRVGFEGLEIGLIASRYVRAFSLFDL